MKDGNEEAINAMLPDKLPKNIQKLYGKGHEWLKYPDHYKKGLGVLDVITKFFTNFPPSSDSKASAIVRESVHNVPQ